MQAVLRPAFPFRVESDRNQDRRAAICLLLGLTLVAAVPAAMIPAPSLWLFAALSMAAAVLIEPTLGLYALIAVVGLDTSGPNTAPLGDIFAGIPGVKATPVELLILWTTFAAYARSFGKEREVSDRMVLVALLVFLLTLIQSVFLGMSRGGSFTIALWEVRALLCLLPVMLATNLLVRARDDLKRLAIVISATLILMTLEAFWRYVTYIRPGNFDGILEFTFSHETSVLVAVLMVGAGAWALWGPNRKHKLVALGVFVVAAVVEMTMRRRAGLIAAEAGILMLGVVLLLKDFRRFLIIAPVFLVVVSVYMVMFWNNQKSLGEPVRAFRTVFDSESVSGRDRASDEYRRVETLNVWSNIKSSPIEGIGFGVAYAKPHSFPNLTSFWPFWDFIPHNTILWLWMKAGAPAFMAFSFLLGVAMVRIIAVVRSASDGFLIAVAASMAAFIPMMILFSYVDLGLTNARLMILTGICFGLVGLMQRLAISSEKVPSKVLK